MTPLDTCGIIHLTDERYARVHNSKTPGAQAVMENYRIWTKARGNKGPDPAERGSTLFDTVAVCLGYSEELLKMETLKLSVTDDGYTKIDEGGVPVRCAMEWQDLGAFEEHLVERIIG